MFIEDYEIKENEYFVNVFNKNLTESPDKLFLSMEDEEGKTFSYTRSQFDDVSRRFYKYLTDNGLSNDSTVSLIFDNRFKLVVSILTCIRFGIIFTITGKDNPLKKSIYQIKNSNSSYIITDKKLEEDLINTVFDVIYYEKAIEYSKKQAQLPKMNIDDVSCICYTSGTTGNPKGMEINYGAITNASISYITKIRGKYDNRLTSAVSAKETFIAFFNTILPYIYMGSTIYITNDEETRNYSSFLNFLIRNKIEDTFFPPIMIDHYLNNVNNSFLKNIVTGGDKVKLTKLNDSIDVTVIYGLSETLGIITSYKIDSLDKPSCLGKPFLNTRLYVLNNDYNQCGKDQIGQIAVSGMQIAKNYINNNEETRKHFIDNPYYDENNDEEYYKKLFLTGDYGYIGDDGNLYFASRHDNQVKIRGQRVEINEITNTVDQIKEVSKNFILAKQDNNDETYLTCFFVSDTLSESKLRDILNDELVDYKVPSFIIKLDEMPLTSHHKVDVKKLEEIEYQSDKIIHPTNYMENKLLELVSKVFKLPEDSISTDDDFANLGADSMTYLILLEDINEEIGRKLSLNEVLTYNTIKSLAEYIENSQKNSIIVKPPKNKKELKINETWLSKILIPIFSFLFKIVYRPHIKGNENIPKEGRIIITSNHIHFLDSMMLIVSAKRRTIFIGKDELNKGKWRYIFNKMPMIPVDRNNIDIDSLEMSLKELKSENAIAIFPEGRVKLSNELTDPFKTGATSMAIATDTKIVPCAITGNYNIIGEKIKITIGKPYTVKTKNQKLESEKLREKINEMIKENS